MLHAPRGQYPLYGPVGISLRGGTQLRTEWERLHAFLPAAERPATRGALWMAIRQRIRQGEADAGS